MYIGRSHDLETFEWAFCHEKCSAWALRLVTNRFSTHFRWKLTPALSFPGCDRFTVLCSLFVPPVAVSAYSVCHHWIRHRTCSMGADGVSISWGILTYLPFEYAGPWLILNGQYDTGMLLQQSIQILWELHSLSENIPIANFSPLLFFWFEFRRKTNYSKKNSQIKLNWKKVAARQEEVAQYAGYECSECFLAAAEKWRKNESLNQSKPAQNNVKVCIVNIKRRFFLSSEYVHTLHAYMSNRN